MGPSVILALDTATPKATVAVVREAEVVGERLSSAASVFGEAELLLRAAGVSVQDVEALAVGTGPGSFTGLRIGLAAVRGLALTLGIPAAGGSTLAALTAGAPGALPVIDARRREVFTLVDGEPCALTPDRLEIEPGELCVGDGAVRYRTLLEARGAEIPPDASSLHTPWARFHALGASAFRPAELIEPTYVRAPDAERRAGAAA